YACCSPGTLPDFTPKPDASGNCYVYTVKSQDTCATIAAAKSMDWTKIDGYNNQTWGYTGCSNIQIGQNICLSSGSPPFPAPVTGTVCGPQVPGTQKPTSGSPWDWAKLNQCPLNACCDQWGQCGVTPDFCTNTTKPGGAPGTALPNTNGCISNCGTNVVQTPGKNEQFRIGYFESWNLQRPCDVMDVSKVNANGYYTHVHWGFANITSSWNVDVSGAQDQFNGFLKVSNVKKILSFGGWGLSTSPATFEIFRTGVLDGNRQVLATNIVNFIQANNLDGVDFDWEYPGAQDIPGLPADSLDSGANYAKFLALVRAALPQGKTLSIALPASYWYLKGFAPLTMFDKSVDYYVYMTYDLHGQWDYNNKFTDPGCPNGNCLRSHVNKTETAYALAMVTKAGIPSYKIMPGLALYGRSFGMTDPLCTGPMCHYGGPDSTAIPGVCTKTAGYLSNVEINSIIAAANENDAPNTASILMMEDEGDILVYNSTQWVSYLSPSSYSSRQQWYQSLGFGGSADW
ncbi:glycoside hydrolase family 18 protein, partial [Myriangium duriaei CBS 260.36]